MLEQLRERVLRWLVSRGWAAPCWPRSDCGTVISEVPGDVTEFERIKARDAMFSVMPSSTAEAASGAQSVTRDVAPSAVADLLIDPRRASVAFVEHGAAQLLPVRSRGCGDVHEFAVRAGDAPNLDGCEVVLIRDDGAYWFELRGISVRGIARRIDARQPADAGGLLWYALEPRRVLAWDYATIRNA